MSVEIGSPYSKVVDLLHKLEAQIDDLLYLKGEMKVHIDDPFEQPFDILTTSLKDLWYKDGEDGRKTRVYAGVVEGSTSVLEQVDSINLTKKELQAAIQNVGYLSPAKKKRFQSDLYSISSWRAGLSNMGIGRINLNHCYRAIPVHHRRVSVVSYSWYTSGQSHKVISPQQAEKLLVNLQRKSNSESIQNQLSMLGNHPHHIKLVQIQKLAPHLKANIFGASSSKPDRTLTPPLPIFIPHSDVTVKQERKSLEDSIMAVRKKRNDLAIEKEPFLPSIRVHRKIT
ncbi:hypothetical protein [Vibrio owensii]|uniref:hypothetical protein n=1 Tax=Vibrio owensii TaxID=696485 RepID=UPI003CC58D99